MTSIPRSYDMTKMQAIIHWSLNMNLFFGGGGVII